MYIAGDPGISSEGHTSENTTKQIRKTEYFGYPTKFTMPNMKFVEKLTDVSSPEYKELLNRLKERVSYMNWLCLKYHKSSLN